MMKVLYEAGAGLQEITEMSVFDRVARLKYAEKIEDVNKVLEEVRGLSADQFEIIKV